MAPSGSNSVPHAFVTGVTGQDGYYLARLLLGRGMRVTGGVMEMEMADARAIAEEIPGLELTAFDLRDGDSVRSVIADVRPDQIYHLAAQSNVRATWADPIGAFDVNSVGTVRMLEAMRSEVPGAHFVFAGSADCLDHEAARETGVTPDTPLRCTNPYAVSKASAIQMCQCYREQHRLRVSVAFLMNHTSPRRPEAFVERKIVRRAAEVSRGRAEELVIGSLETTRDWSWAEDLVEAMAAMGGRERAGDYVLASGRTRTIGDWIRLTFDRLGLDPERQLRIDPELNNRGDRAHTFGNIEPARRELGWTPQTSFEQIVDQLIDAELGADIQRV